MPELVKLMLWGFGHCAMFDLFKNGVHCDGLIGLVFVVDRKQGTTQEQASSVKGLVQEVKSKDRESELHCRVCGGFQLWGPWCNHSHQ